MNSNLNGYNIKYQENDRLFKKNRTNKKYVYKHVAAFKEDIPQIKQLKRFSKSFFAIFAFALYIHGKKAS
jgi:hypothetical protein